MKKTLLLAQCFPPEFGGTASLYYNICKNLNNNAISVIAKKYSNWKEFDANQKFRIYRFDGFSHINSKVISESLRILFIVLKDGMDTILYGHINFCLTALILKFVFGRNYYLYVHGEEITRNYGGRYYQYFKWKCLKYARGIVVVSEYTKKLVEKYNNNVKVIYNAIDTSVFVPKIKDRELIVKHGLLEKIVLLTISRLEDRKGHDVVIRVLPKILKIYSNVKYLIVGSGAEEKKLRLLVDELGLKEYVEFVGEIPENRLCDYYNLCDIFVMPNRETPDGNTEGFGIVFLEANACGKPVIGGNAGGVPSAIRNGYNGFLVNGNNESNVYDKLTVLLKDKDLRSSIGNNALEWVKGFTYEKLVRELRCFMGLEK